MSKKAPRWGGGNIEQKAETPLSLYFLSCKTGSALPTTKDYYDIAISKYIQRE